MPNRVIHFEIQADNVERAKTFYEKALGWKIEKFSGPGVGMDYWMVMTGREGEPGINGGMYQRGDDKLYTYDCTVLVPDIDTAIAAVKANGGKISPMPPEGKEKHELPGVGWFARATDTEGNRMGLMQATDWQPR